MENNEKINSAVPGQAPASNRKVQTYAEDLAKAMEEDKGKVVKEIIRGEEELPEVNLYYISPQAKRNKRYISFGLMFLFLAAAILAAFFYFGKDAFTVPALQQFTPLIFSDQTDFIEVAGQDKAIIIQKVREAIDTSEVKRGGVEGIYLTETKKVIGLRRLIALLGWNFVPADAALVYDYFLMGFINNQITPVAAPAPGKDFFMIIKMRSTADIFTEMRTWEPKMFSDLHGALGMNITSFTNYLLNKNFEDGLIDNKNARILHDKDGKIVLLYVFANDNSLVITSGEKAAREIMLRLTQKQAES